MSERIQLTPSRKAAWIVNASQHLGRFEASDPGLSKLETLLFAGRCGSLLIKVAADDTEQLTHTKVKAHARVAGIDGPVLRVYLDTLKAFGCIDWDSDLTTFEVLPFGRLRVLETTSQVFDGQADSTPHERTLPELLEFCLIRPRLESEMRAYLSPVLAEPDLDQLLALVERFQILGALAIEGTPERLYFNGYQFGERAKEIGKVLAGLPQDKRDALTHLVERVMSSPGLPPENAQVPAETLDQAIALGLVELSEVASPAGSAQFLTMPNLAAPSVGTEVAHLEDDVFHHAKMFLSSLRYGELRSNLARGKIVSPSVLVRALLDRDRVGPCTAIGQDYTILEAEGVIRTIRAEDKPGRQFHMELRRREPAEVVLGLLESGASSRLVARTLSAALELPMSYKGPDAQRPAAARKAIKEDPETFRRFLEELRT